MSFESDIETWLQKTEQRERDLFVNTASAIKFSITDGSPVTGAPGQPVDTGALKNSWILEFVTPWVAMISTNIGYAPGIENGLGSLGQPIQLRSAVGGFHSVALTRAGFRELVFHEARALGAPG